MRVAIAGAGAVGRSVARELISNGHKVLLIDKDPGSIKPERVSDAEWLLADSCEMSSLEEARLAQELALIAVKADVTEELDRLGTHVTAARRLLGAGGPVGRKLDFLTQEFNREVNTLCSKAQSAELTALGLGELAHGDRLLNSAELGAAKPDPEAYARALARIEAVLGRRVEPATIAFLDDGPGNVTAARAAGWQAVHLPAH